MKRHNVVLTSETVFQIIIRIIRDRMRQSKLEPSGKYCVILSILAIAKHGLHAMHVGLSQHMDFNGFLMDS